LNNKYSAFFSDEGVQKPFADVLPEVQEYISSKFSTLITDNPEEQKKQICAYIAKYLTDSQISVDGYDFDGLIERLYVEMAEFSFLTQYLFSNDVEEININSWKDVKITYANGKILPADEHFNSPQHAIDVIRRVLHQSGMILDHSQPVVRGHLSNKIRITVLGNPITDEEKGVAASIRIVNPKQLGKKDFVKNKTATAEMLDFLSTCLRYGLSMCVTGATGSGKTTVMAWFLSTISPKTAYPKERRRSKASLNGSIPYRRVCGNGSAKTVCPPAPLRNWREVRSNDDAFDCGVRRTIGRRVHDAVAVSV
jgi:pilus assembly protein CpaF